MAVIEERAGRLSSVTLGVVGGLLGAASALSSLFAPGAPDFSVVRESMAAGVLALVCGIVGLVAGAESAAHPKAGGALMLLAATGGLLAVRSDFVVAAGLLAVAGVIALAEPPAVPHEHVRRRVPSVG